MTEEAPPRRLRAADVIEAQHETIQRLTEPRKPASLAPSFKVAQVKAVGGAVVHEWEVHIPVCDEYPTADDAYAAVSKFSGFMLANFPPPHVNGDKP